MHLPFESVHLAAGSALSCGPYHEDGILRIGGPNRAEVSFPAQGKAGADTAAALGGCSVDVKVIAVATGAAGTETLTTLITVR